MTPTLRRVWLTQLLGFLVMALVIWAFLNTPDQRAWQVGVSALLALAVLAGTTWLIAANLGAAFPPPASRLARVFGCLLLLLLLLWAIGLADDKSWNIARWLASTLTMSRKKPVTPDAMSRAFAWLLFFVRWILLPLLLLPLAVRAAGAKPVRFRKLAAIWIALFLVGAVVPHLLVNWVPHLPGLWLQLLSAAVRFLVAYLLLVTAWVFLGRLLRAEHPN